MSYLSKAFQGLDNAIVYGANKSAEVWNWTTGRTRRELANLLLNISPLLEVAGIGMVRSDSSSADLFAIFTIAAFGMANSHYIQKKHSDMEKMEKRMSEGAIPASLVTQRSAAKARGYWYLSWGPVFPLVGLSLDQTLAMSTLDGGIALRAGSDFIMASGDYLPPRKNCLQRGMDYFAKKVASGSKEPVAVPVLAR